MVRYTRVILVTPLYNSDKSSCVAHFTHEAPNMTNDCLSLSLARAKPTPPEDSLEGCQVETARQNVARKASDMLGPSELG